jgi:seryl-tRNA synthetase
VIDVRLLRSDLAAVRAGLARRGKTEIGALLDEAVALDEKVRDVTARRDEIRAKVNDISKSVGQMRREGRDADAEEAMARSRAFGEEETALATDHDGLEARLREVLLHIPNIPHPAAPDGASDADNPVIKGPVAMPDAFADHQRVPHWETAAALGILDNERAVKIAGSMFTMQRGLGATLARALCQFALDSNADAFEEIRPPSLGTTATLTATGHLPKFADDAFAIERYFKRLAGDAGRNGGKAQSPGPR